MENINRILVTGGATKYFRKALQYGVSLSRMYGAEIYILHVVHNPFGYEGFNLPMISLDKEYENLITDAKNELDAIVAEEKAKGLPVQSLIMEGDPASEIIKVIEEKKIDLLIMLAHKESRLEHLESRLERLIFGRSYEALIRKMPCAILLVNQEATRGE
jgi:nucleotide-binding universal stress UspA family protein